MTEPDEPTASRSAAAQPMALVAIAVAVVAVAIGIATISPPVVGPRQALGAAPSIGPAPGGSGTGPSEPRGSLAPPTMEGGSPSVGSLAVVDADGGLSIIGPSGRTVALTSPGELTVGFPAWSPDGTRVAAVVGRAGTTTIEVFPVDPSAGTAGRPVALYASSLRQAFYVSWTPGGHAVSFLANDADLVDLRIVETDRSAPAGDDEAGTLIRKGAPLYFDWLDDERALLHVGVGDRAFLAIVGRDGHELGGDLLRPGDFRSAQVSADGRFVGFVRAAGDQTPAEAVLAPIAGGPEVRAPIYGASVVSFSPAADLLSALGSDRADAPQAGFPVGPLRILDAGTGGFRTLIDGAVVAGFWSPDGRTIAAIRLQVRSGSTAAATPSAVPTEVHALFVDVASGAISADHVVQPGPRFVSELLPYFDQYELSHRLWAPDSSSFLLPIVGDDGRSTTIALRRDGAPSPFTIGVPAAFWSP